MNVRNNVQQFLANHKASEQLLIVAVSGGKDSMALLHACRDLELDVVAVHCNFMLRGSESMLDEAFVAKYCSDRGIAFESIRFQTKEESATLKLSTQETARKLRYQWFEELRNKYSARYILTAHHANDVAETFFINLLRGSGIKGLRSIPAIKENIMRPLIHTPAREIEMYIESNRIPYRDDESNQADAYKRNYIRHHIIPHLQHVNERALEHLVHATTLLSESYALLEQSLGHLKSTYTTQTNDSFIIDLEKLSAHGQKNLLLFEWLYPYGFNTSTILDISGPGLSTGNQWMGRAHVALYNRGKLIVTASDPGTIHEEELTAWPDLIRFGKDTYRITRLEQVPAFYDRDALYFDSDLVRLPVKLRTWKQGDTFRPLGMTGEKKVSDFFIDAKISLNKKQEAMIIEGHQGIIAVAPYRISDSCKINAATRNILVLTREG